MNNTNSESWSGRLAFILASVGARFDEFLHSPWEMIAWHFLFMAATVYVVSRGVRTGLEKLVKVLMPALLITLVALVIYAAIVGDFVGAVNFLFAADLAKLSPEVVLAAVGQAFFSINVGVGVVLTYSAYLPKDVNLFRSAIVVVLGDTLVALLAGLAIFPIVFANNLDPGEGPGLIFVTLSTAFAQMPGGTLVGTGFFAMIIFAALTSSISVLETMTARLHEIRGMSRTVSAALIGTGTFLLGLVTVFSFSTWENTYPLGQFEIFAGKTPYDLIDYLVSNILMPLGGMLYALFAGWWLKREISLDEIGLADGATFWLWLLLVRAIAPLAVAAVFVFNLA